VQHEELRLDHSYVILQQMQSECLFLDPVPLCPRLAYSWLGLTTGYNVGVSVCDVRGILAPVLKAI